MNNFPSQRTALISKNAIIQGNGISISKTKPNETPRAQLVVKEGLGVSLGLPQVNIQTQHSQIQDVVSPSGPQRGLIYKLNPNAPNQIGIKGHLTN